MRALSMIMLQHAVIRRVAKNTHNGLPASPPCFYPAKLDEFLDSIEDLQEKEGNIHNPHIEINPERMPIYPRQK